MENIAKAVLSAIGAWLIASAVSFFFAILYCMANNLSSTFLLCGSLVCGAILLAILTSYILIFDNK